MDSNAIHPERTPPLDALQDDLLKSVCFSDVPTKDIDCGPAPVDEVLRQMILKFKLIVPSALAFNTKYVCKYLKHRVINVCWRVKPHALRVSHLDKALRVECPHISKMLRDDYSNDLVHFIKTHLPMIEFRGFGTQLRVLWSVKYAEENPMWALAFGPPLTSPSESFPQPPLDNSFNSPAGFRSNFYRRRGARRFDPSRQQSSARPSTEASRRNEGPAESPECDLVDFPTFTNIDPNSIDRGKAPIEEVFLQWGNVPYEAVAKYLKHRLAVLCWRVKPQYILLDELNRVVCEEDTAISEILRRRWGGSLKAFVKATLPMLVVNETLTEDRVTWDVDYELNHPDWAAIF
ncbi:hypothetical protein AAVH_05336 [Aphelenchoides avenae]|nr:hypothetical protein AAVH_05336 [Aphelenchus avenae]